MATLQVAVYDAVMAVRPRYRPYLYAPPQPDPDASLDGAAAAAAGRFRGVNPINRYWPSIRPFVLTSMSQFRPGPPPALDSAEYAADFNETRELGGAVSPRRSADQTALARFHSEPPPAIALADSDGNPATTADPQWKPLLPTPNHPEYPAAHSCSAGFVGEVLRRHYGTEAVSYTWDSKVTGNARIMRHTGELADESRMARIYGGMHFRFATTAGAQLGRQVGAWTMEHAFQPR